MVMTTRANGEHGIGCCQDDDDDDDDEAHILKEAGSGTIYGTHKFYFIFCKTTFCRWPWMAAKHAGQLIPLFGLSQNCGRNMKQETVGLSKDIL